jgi:signal transduction histidine kinase
LQTLSDLLERHHAYEVAVSEERSRINRDIHDNVGVLLMGALHSDAVSRKDVLIRQTLKELREIISNQAKEHAQLGNVLADLRSEINDHIEATGLKLRWQNTELPEVTLPPIAVHCLNALFREAANNILRHSEASLVDIIVTYKTGLLRVKIMDNGVGLSTDQPLGNGIENLQNRLRSCGGSCVISSRAEGGTSVLATLPIEIRGDYAALGEVKADQKRTA